MDRVLWRPFIDSKCKYFGFVSVPLVVEERFRIFEFEPDNKLTLFHVSVALQHRLQNSPWKIWRLL